MKLKTKLISIYEQCFPVIRRFRFDIKYRFDVMSMEETVTYIKETNCSIARYGDGEFGIIMKSNHPDFQDENDHLASRLKEVCRSEDKRLLVCIPHNLKTTKDCNEFARKFWDWWLWNNNNLENVARILGLNFWRRKKFGDAQITRPYMDWQDKSIVGERFERLKSLWYQKDILIIEGSDTKIGIGNDLLDDAKSVERILAPPVNAYSYYYEILEKAKENGKDKLILIALGPTATVLAYDLAIADYQVLDIGHIDIEYEWFLQGAEKKEAVRGKATQEAHVQCEDVYGQDFKYLSQIVARIGC